MIILRRKKHYKKTNIITKGCTSLHDAIGKIIKYM